MKFTEWCETVPDEIQQDRVWRIKVYQLAMSAAEIGWADVTRLASDRRTLDLTDQLYRSIGSISANVAEEFSRGSRRDRARFYGYALGSASEARDWYYKRRHVLDADVVTHRLRLYSELVRLLLTMIPDQRGTTPGEPKPTYEVDPLYLLDNVPLS